MKIVTEFPFAITDDPDIGIVLSDGCRLSARVWRPAGTGAVPAVLEYIPYRKRDGTLPRDEMMHAYVAGHGYACVRVDMRGNGDSDGLMTDEYTIQELADACEVIEWLAAQEWCSGAVGMMGKSWGGFNCLQTAFLQPPALKAVISACSTTDRFADDIHYKGGCLLGENFGWGAVMLSYSSRPSDPVLRPDWRETWLQRLDAEPWLAPRWAEMQEKNDYWKHGSVSEDYSRMTVPVLSWGGWADNYMNTVAHLVENVPAPVQGIVGPWVHQYPHTAVPGPAIGFLQVALRWWDRWLKGIENGAESDPAYRAYMIHSEAPDASAKHRAGHWVAEAAWPSPRVSRAVLALGAGTGESGTPSPDPSGGTLGGMVGQQFSVAVNTPQQLGMHTGEFFPMGLNAEMPGDQASDDALSVCFDGAVLAQPLDLLGAARLSLTLASDQPLGFVVARLCDVAPDGSSVRIAHGMLNLCHRDSMEQPAPMPLGQAVELAFNIDQMAYRLAAGHHLRLALSTTYWPFLWPSPQPATLTLTSGSLNLPVHHGSENEWEPPSPEAAKPWAHKVLRAGKTTRKIETDLLSGITALVISDDLGDVENLSHGLCTGESMTELWEIHPDDPLSARAVHTWEQRLSRGDWSVKTNAWAEMTATASHLHLKASLTAWEGDTKVFERHYDDKVPRRFV
ncbi:CocE/NonD family hydrolase [Cypionkella sp.]|uniref:CocE/NonD family hydrolase n=1 Tax=Cypionkella sp. TaxID=2811411 RepID=UPI002717F82B|nr:CocE/NonD family hydrolase [Cypionkella sp.]MDO8982204.1 CocE/NonD family hydrolase [Cypionkella sp.]MDP2049893.1 CocE/NonD family hydrolase [Cypionkella sp.]